MPRRHRPQVQGGSRFEVQQPRPAVARVHVAGDGEQPRTEPRVGTKAACVLHQSQPGLFQQVFSNIPPVRKSGKKVVQAAVEGLMNRVERGGIPRSQAADELELELAIHSGHNAADART